MAKKIEWHVTIFSKSKNRAICTLVYDSKDKVDELIQQFIMTDSSQTFIQTGNIVLQKSEVAYLATDKVEVKR